MIFSNIVSNIFRPLGRLTNFRTIDSKLDATRTYARWTSRSHVAIVNEDELYETKDTTKERSIRNREIPLGKSKKKRMPVKSEESPSTEKKQTSRFTILKGDDKIITSLMTKVKSRKRAEKNNEIILEGHRLIKEGLKAGAIPNAIFFNDPSDIDELQPPNEVKLYKIPYNTLKIWSSVTHCSGLIGIFQTPDVQNKDPADDSLPLTIICDNVRDPGNLGSIMRAAAGVGCEKLILLKGCVDLWDPKVIRSAAGTHFQIPIHAFPTWDQIPFLISENCNVFVTDSNFGDKFTPEYTSDELQLSMGMFNVNPESIKTSFSLDNKQEDIKSESKIPTNKKMMKEFLLQLPIVPYYTLDYTQQEIVLVLSGETEGLSLHSYKFLSERKGIRINIPLATRVNSLNAGVALGIVTFEIKRQFIKKQSEL